MPGEDIRCAYCGLPVRGRAETAPVYCCWGCRLASQVPATGTAGPAIPWPLVWSLWCTLNVMMFSLPLWGPADSSGLGERFHHLLRWGALLVSTPVVLGLGWPLAEHLAQQLRNGQGASEALLLTGVLTAWVTSVWSTLQGTGHVYYEVSCVILLLVSFGRWFEATLRWQAQRRLSELERILPRLVRCQRPDGTWEQRELSAVQVGDVLWVGRGERIPCDGVVHSGLAVVDERFFTGESQPCEKGLGDFVMGGSLNVGGGWCLQARAVGTETVLQRMVQGVQTAQRQRGPFQQLADRWARRLMPLIVGLALSAGMFHSWRSGFEAGWRAGMSVLLIACPCALALATPLAVWMGLAGAAQRGVLFRSGEMLERLAAVQRLWWDKTGTLTSGHGVVRRLQRLGDTEVHLLRQLCEPLARASQHVHAQAVLDYWSSQEAAPLEPSSAGWHHWESFPGCGVRATHPQWGTVWFGSPRWLQQQGLQSEGVLEADAGGAQVCIGWQGAIRGIFEIEEQWRPETLAVLHAAREAGLQPEVLTGDRRSAAESWSRGLGVPVHAGLLPADKADRVRQACQQGVRIGFVGDGVNDAWAMSASTVGIALGCGADVARETAGVCVLGNNLHDVLWAWRWARRTVRVIRQNVLWSFGYNSVGVALAWMGWLHPAWAAFLMVLSSVWVLGNALRLRPETALSETVLQETTSDGVPGARRDVMSSVARDVAVV
ncbi:MAG: copper-translocating P-type ATPase [Planctomycetaceae bacterium]|nr:MAG: copper-translocating P-type ATPase [Planctomycetaceae bacterium]